MKIIFCISQTYKIGGTVRVIANRINHFAFQDDFQFHILTTDQHGQLPALEMAGQVFHHDLGINYDDNCNSASYKRIFPAFQKRILHLHRLKALLAQVDPDIIVTLGGAEAHFLPFICGRAKIIYEVHLHKYFKKYVSNREDWIYRLKSTLETQTLEGILKKYNRVIFLTKAEASYHDFENYSVIPNSIVIDELEPRPIHDREKIVLFVGHFSKIKGIEELIDIWKWVAPRNPGWELHCYGSGDLLENVQGRIRRYGLSERIRIFPPVKDTTSLFKKVSLLVLPSKTEQFPMVILEAMNAGTPCIAYDCPAGISEVIIDGVNGRIVPDQDAIKFAKILNEILSDKMVLLHLSENAKQQVKTFSELKVMKLWKELYEEILI